MDAPHRGALMLVRFIAACLMGMSVVELALYWAEYRLRNVPVNVPLAILWGMVFLAGVGILIKAKAVAEWVAGNLE